jgi:predicted ArsR family transcriptional regulator
MHDRPDIPSEPRAELLRLLRYEGPLSLDELAERMGLSKTAARSHALRLEDAGLIRRTHPPAERPGRPPVHFELTPAGADTFPQHEPDLLRRLLEFLLGRGERDTVEAFFAEVWQGRRARFERALDEMPDRSLDSRLRALERVLAEDGFMPRLGAEMSSEGQRLVVVRECNCPLPSALSATRIPCELETRFLADAVAGHTLSASVASSRSDTCEFRMRVGEP